MDMLRLIQSSHFTKTTITNSTTDVRDQTIHKSEHRNNTSMRDT